MTSEPTDQAQSRSADASRSQTILRESEEQFRTIAETLPGLAWLVDAATGEYRFVNRSFCEFAGREPSGLLGRVYADLLHPADVETLTPKFAAAMAARETFEAEYRIRRHDGQWRWHLVRAAPQKDANGRVVQWFGMGVDITERKQAEERARLEQRETAFANRVLGAFIEVEGEELFERALAIVQEEMASQHGVFGYISEPGHLICPSLSPMLDACEVAGKCIHYPPEKWKGLWARALTEKRSLYTNEPPQVPPGHLIVHNNLAAPILFRGEAIGLLNLANKDGGYSEADRERLDTLAARVAPVLYSWVQRKLRDDERKQAAAALRESEQRIQQALRVSRSFTFEWRPATDTVLRSASCAPILGVTGTEMTNDTGQRFFERVHPDDRERFVAMLGALSPANTGYETEYRVARGDGREVVLEEIGAATFDAAGRLERLVGVSTDITARKQAEAALAASHRQLQSVIDNTTSMVYACDLESRFVMANAALAALLQTTPAQMLGKRRHEFMPLEDAAKHEAHDREVMAAGRAVEFEEHSELHGRSFTWLSTKFPLRDAQERIYAVAGIVTDISARKQAEEAVRTSLEEKEALLKEVHHRVKNNMQVLSSLVSMQERSAVVSAKAGHPSSEAGTDDSLPAAFSDLRDRIRSMALVHENLYRSASLARIDFGEYARGLTAYLAHAHSCGNTDIRLTLDVESVTLPIDSAVPCGLILNELVTNAYKHAFRDRRSGTITVRLRTDPAGHVSLFVCDDGAGLPAGLDWRQAPSLGLRLVLMLTSQVRGRVEARKPEGGGTEFALEFETTGP